MKKWRVVFTDGTIGYFESETYDTDTWTFQIGGKSVAWINTPLVKSVEQVTGLNVIFSKG